MELLIDIEALGIADLRRDPSDFGEERLELLVPGLRVTFEILNELIVLFLLDESFQVLDVLIQLRRSLLNGLDVAMKGLSLCEAAVMHQTPFLDDLGKLGFHSLKLTEIFLLNLGVLNFDDSQVLLILLG